MAAIGQGQTALIAGGALVIAALSAALAWPFAIDDAFIGIRYARHLVSGAGYVWNVGGPSTDGVTPLPWAFLLAPIAHGAPVVVLARAKLAGAIVSCVTAASWGKAIAGVEGAPPWALAAALGLLALNLPLAAHSVSGMETVFATSLATLAALAHARPRVAALLAGLAATLRPELVVWALVVAVGFAWVTRPAERWRVAVASGIAFLPFALCALVRGIVFGRVAPLSVFAKPSDLAHGLAYAGAAFVFTLAPIVLLSPRTLLRERGPALVLALAAAAHFLVLVAVGGDWMPYARLAVPILPSLLYAFVLASPHARGKESVVRVGLALTLGGYFFLTNVPKLRRAGEDRAALLRVAEPVLAGSPSIATVDIGWASALSEGTIFDLAGVTDPEIAVLMGGHTSKRIDPALLLAHGSERLLFYSDALPKTLADVSSDTFPRVVEARLVRTALFAQKYEPAAFIPLGKEGAGYVVYVRRIAAATSD